MPTSPHTGTALPYHRLTLGCRLHEGMPACNCSKDCSCSKDWGSAVCSFVGNRDRAEERRKGVNPDYERVNADLASIVTGNVALERDITHISVEDSKFLGGDVEHTHLVKGLDYALLQKVGSAGAHKGLLKKHPHAICACMRSRACETPCSAWRGQACSCVERVRRMRPEARTLLPMPRCAGR